ncbi:MAG TPA: PfkB family carbohydrate kinase [Opitutaceae bacterium]|jgi:fructokinase|nr:PfkB family carbohydrate kinase [Opitutaceae bacterium]
MNATRPLALYFGEILWDFLPEGLFPGGAPLNAAYHMHQHGTDAQVVSAVGRDVLGDELLRRCTNWGLATEGIARLEDMPTGHVCVDIGQNGDARFDIVTNVAWDKISANNACLRIAAKADAFLFGSLAQRSLENRATLDRLLAALPKRALRVFDANLRPPYDDLELVRQLARKATVLKLNVAEAARLATNEIEMPGHEEAHARLLAEKSGCGFVVVTAGARGAGMLRDGRWLWEPGRPVKVADTVGAGDAFAASLVAHLLHGQSPDREILARACRLGEWVASQRGATPAYTSLQYHELNVIA